eukprot:281175-Rhodomonas_salina.1
MWVARWCLECSGSHRRVLVVVVLLLLQCSGLGFRIQGLKAFLVLFQPNSGQAASMDTPKVKACTGMLVQRVEVVTVGRKR